MSCRLQSRIPAILILATTLFLCLSTHGSVFGRSQSVQLGRTLPNRSKLGVDRVALGITEQQSDAASSGTPGPWLSQARHSAVNETENLQHYKSSLVIRQSNETAMFTPSHGGDGEELFQSDSPGFDKAAAKGKVRLSSAHMTENWLQMRPQVQCSPGAIILTAKGWNYVHFLVDRVGESPVSLLHLPSHCGYNVRATWRDLVLVAPYDGCYVLQQNGSYVLPLRWWGMPVSISCPMSSASASATPSGFCSNLGITLRIEGSQKSLEKYNIKVNEEWVPLVSNMCAYRLDLTNEDLILFIPFSVPCAKDVGSTLNVLLDERMYSLSCQPHHYIHSYPLYNPSASSSLIIPFAPTLTEPKVTNVEQPQHHIVMTSDQPITDGATESHPQLPSLQSSAIFQVPVLRSSELSSANTELTLPFQPQSGNLQLNIPMGYPPYQHVSHPTYPYYHQKPTLPDSHVPNYTAFNETPKPQMGLWPEVINLPRWPQMVQLPQLPQIHRPPDIAQVPQGHRFPVLVNNSSQWSPVLTCKEDYLKASLHSAKRNSVKVKDVNRKVWVPVASVPADCGYSLQRKGRGVIFFSPLPACHSYIVPPSLLSLSIKFWDSAIRRHRALRLQCPYTSPSPPITNLSTTPASLPIVGLSSKPSQLEVPFLHPTKRTVESFQHSKDPELISFSSKLTRRTPPLASQTLQPEVFCHAKDMSVTLPSGPITGLKVDSPVVGVQESIKEMVLDKAPSHCGYLMKKSKNGGINILMPYTACHMIYKDGQYRIVLKYSVGNRRIEASLSCQVPVSHECNLPLDQQLACGSSSVLVAECRDLGCCYSPDTQTCYYPMDECTADRHFVFSVPASLTQPPLSPVHLAVAGNSSCTSQRVVANMALFKIPLDGCGSHKYEVGNTVIYMVEILNTLQSVTLNYGTITRDSPFRLLVECRYLPGTVASVGYLVKSPSLGPSIHAKGVFGVQLRIAKDQKYISYYPQYHRPLRTLLGKPLYLEVRLLNPVDPSAVLLVHYCVAYPRSAHSAWVLIYDGCPNPLDATPSHEPPPTPSDGLASHVRRFTISTFQFLENGRKEMTPGEEEAREEEEIYFMCATEVCLPSEGPCVEGCIDHSPALKS